MQPEPSSHLPIDDVTPEIARALASGDALVLIAPPGAGKSTRLPLALLDGAWLAGQKMILVVPRRLAALGAAKRMANALNEKVGQTVGHRVRMDTAVGPTTRIEVVTAGVFTRMISADPELLGVGLVMFDEVHERALSADLGLGFALETKAVLRDDLRLMVMSATLDGERFGKLLADVSPTRQIVSDGAIFPIETFHEPSDKPGVQAVIDAALDGLKRFPGDGLIFLPGQREIEAAAADLQNAVGDAIAVHRLYGAVPRAQQDDALRPDKLGRRKLVVASSIAETSLTIPGVRFVIDTGLARRPVFDPLRGITRLETQPASRAAIDQRRGRAGRLAAGYCVRLWRKEEEGGRPSQDPPEILAADLAPMRLEMAAWGATQRDSLSFIDPPGKGAWEQAGILLQEIGAIDAGGKATALGQKMAHQPLHPRLSAMMERAKDGEKSDAAWAAVLASELVQRGPLNAHQRLTQASRATSQHRELKRLHQHLLADQKPKSPPDAVALARHLSAAYPDRVAQRQKDDGRVATYKLARGNQAILDLHDPLASNQYLLVVDLGGGRRSSGARLPDIRMALPLERSWIEDWLAHRIDDVEIQAFDPDRWVVKANLETRLDKLVLAKEVQPTAGGMDSAEAITAHIEKTGLLKALNPDKAGIKLVERIEAFLKQQDNQASLLDRTAQWLPSLLGFQDRPPFSVAQLNQAFRASLSWDEQQTLDSMWPAKVKFAGGQEVAIDYEHPAGAAVSILPKQLYGQDDHPTYGPGKTALVVEFLSPARRPIALTSDLPAFWRAGWLDVRKDMRARYPKHNWPEKPWLEQPTRSDRGNSR